MLYLLGKAFYIDIKMNITFKDKKNEKIFNNSDLLDKEFGANSAVIRRRMAVLKAAPSLFDVSHLKPERRHELTGKKKGYFAVDLKHPFRLVFRPNHGVLPKKDDGGIDLMKVTDITIVGVEDYH